MQNFIWKKSHNPALLLSRLNKVRNQTSGKVSYDAFASLDLTVTIVSCLDTSSSLTQTAIETCVRKALSKPQKNGKLDKDTFLEDLELALIEYQLTPLVKFYLVTSLSYRGAPPFKKLQNKNSTIHLDFPNIERFSQPGEFNRNDAEKELQRLLPHKPSLTYRNCVVEVLARNVWEAYQLASGELDEFRGIVNLFYNSRKHQRMSSGGLPQPVNDLRLGRLHTVHDHLGKIPHEQVWYDMEFVEPRTPVDLSKNAANLKKFIKKARRKLSTSSIGDVCTDAIRRYCRSLDKADWSVAFKDLWATLEFCTNTAKSTYDVTIKRAATSYRDYEFAVELGKHLRSRRNRLVHSHFDEKDSEALVFQLKRLVEPLLFRLLWNTFGLKNHEEFGQLLDQPMDKAQLLGRVHLAKAAIKYHGF